MTTDLVTALNVGVPATVGGRELTLYRLTWEDRAKLLIYAREWYVENAQSLAPKLGGNVERQALLQDVLHRACCISLGSPELAAYINTPEGERRQLWLTCRAEPPMSWRDFLAFTAGDNFDALLEAVVVKLYVPAPAPEENKPGPKGLNGGEATPAP
jgi:hypothetical protein